MTTGKKVTAKASKTHDDAWPIQTKEIEEEPVQMPGSIQEESAATPLIVGIGASAGGLEALELFLANVPAASGMAFVIVQHLDPTRKGMLVDLLQRGTPMKVLQVKDRMRVEADCVYVIPPNKDMSILHGLLYLLDPLAPRGLRLPIDFFFRALAEDQQRQAVGVILSGMGSDGSLGLRAIKEKGGVVFVQEPTSAKFDGMPRSAIDAGLADVIGTAGTLPEKINAYVRHVPLITKSNIAETPASQSALDKVVILLRSQTGHDFSRYKKSTIYRRIERRMGLRQAEKITNYVRILQEDSVEMDLLFRDLLIGVTSFFRDPKAWNHLKSEVLPALLAEPFQNRTLRAWIPACASGEEAYSLAILFKEKMQELKPGKNIPIQIFATDLDKRAIEKARDALFPENIVSDVSPERLDRFFVKVANGYQASKSIRSMIIFAPQNIIMDPPFTKLDIVSCRNLLIYLTPPLQMKLLSLFHFSLNPDGFLFLGAAETIGILTNLFVPLAGDSRLYRRLNPKTKMEPIEFPGTFAAGLPGPPIKQPIPTATLQTLAEQLLLHTYSPSAVLTDDKGKILYTSGRPANYLEAATGIANWNIFSMARGGLHFKLTAPFQKAMRAKEIVSLKNLVMDSNGRKHFVDVTFHPLSEPSALNRMMLIVFTEGAEMTATKTTAKQHGDSSRMKELERELEYARQELPSYRAEMQTSQEELRSSNEELQSTNEELQSLNEELTTSKEELQSLNEELHTVNAELETRLDELSRANNDMKNLMDSTDIATVFLDSSLCVRRFTSETCKITQLIPSDVGRPITDISSVLFYPTMADDAREVLQTLVKVEKQVSTPDEHWYAVRILPYRTLDNVIDGVVITFVDIAVSKKLEADLHATEARLREMLARLE
jgi:chemotaxis methyl-accepting protein methylase